MVEWIIYMEDEKTRCSESCSKVLDVVRQLSTDFCSRASGQASTGNLLYSTLPYYRHSSASIEAFSEEDLEMKGTRKGAQELKRDNEGPWNKLEEDVEQQVDVSQDQASPSTSMTKDPPGPSTSNVTPGRIGRQRSFLKKSLVEETHGDDKSPRGEHGNLLKGVGTPKFLLESQGETLMENPEQSMHIQTLVRPHLKKSLLDHEETQGDKKSPRGEHGNLLKGVNFSKSVLESHRETHEQSTRQTNVRRPTGWPYNRRVDWKEDLTLDTKVDEDEKEPTTYETTSSSSSSSSPSPPCSPLQSVAIHKVDHEYETNPSERSLSPLFSTPRQTFDNFPPTSDHCPHTTDSIDHCSHSKDSFDPYPHSNDSLQHKEDVKEDLVKPTIAREGNEILGEDPLAQSISPTTSTSSVSSTRSSTLSSKSLDSNVPLNTIAELDINQAPSISEDCLKAQPGEAGPASVKIPSPSYKMPAKCLMRSPGVLYHRHRSSSYIPSQESDLLKEWTQKRLEDMEERRIKSKEDHKKVLEEAQNRRDASHEERRAEIELRKTKNRQQEQQKMEEYQNHMLSTNMNQWELVVSLINLERPTGTPTTEKDDKKRLVATPSQSQAGPPKVLTKAFPRKSNMKQEKNQVINKAGSEETVEEQNRPLLKNTDLSRMKEILLKLKNNPHGGGK